MMMKLSVVAPVGVVEDTKKTVSEGDERHCLSPSSSQESLSTKVDGNKIRSRLLMRLGFVQQQPSKQQEYKRTSPPPPMRKVAPLVEALKYDEKTEEKDGQGTPRSRKTVVAFSDEVSVVPIPKHQEYSKRIRSRLWCDKQELRRMASRNQLEYQAEGCNPAMVIEDQDFITFQGQKVHPVHLQRLLASPFMMMRQPMRVMQLPPPVEATRRPMV